MSQIRLTRLDGAPVRQVLLKVHSRCNLACDHCYIYEHVDQSWRSRPFIMSAETIDQTAARISEHVAKHDLPFVIVVMHGGEPLLAGLETLDHVAGAVRRAVAGQARVALSIQTNGLLLDERILELFLRHRVRVGISLDGPPVANDRHRRFASGRGSHDATVRAIQRLRVPRYRHLYGGLLCTVDTDNDPVEVYEHLLGFEPPEIDFLLPHGTWSRPPSGRTADARHTPYANWLITIFDRWYSAPAPETRVRTFESLISLLLGGPSGSEAVGLDPVDLVTVETDGTLEQGDVLKITSPGMPETGLHVALSSFDEYLEHSGVRARQSGLAGLCGKCQGCPIVRVCGGGHYAHRYRSDNGFDNPSVYCPDLAKLIRHVADRLVTDLAPITRSAVDSAGQ